MSNITPTITACKQDHVTCTVCGKGFKAESFLAVHLVRVHNHKDIQNRFRKWACDACPKGFFKPSELMRHQRAVHKRLPQDVDEGLDEQTNDHCDHKQGVLVNVPQNDGSYICCICSKQFDWEESYSLHMIRVHEYEDSKERFTRFPCRFCKKVLYKLSDQKRHAKTHKELFNMEETSEHIQKGDDSEHAQKGRSEHANQGEGSEHGKKKRSCEDGQQEIEPKSSSVGEHILECPICSKVFKMEKYVSLHLMRVHGQTDNTGRFKQFPCPICAKIFYKNSDMVCHKKGCSIKDNVKVMKIQKGGLHDSSKSLGNSESVNDGEVGEIATEGNSDRTLQCEHCNQIFLNDDYLELHKVDAHGVTRPSENDKGDAEVCKQCGKQFRTHHSLVRHIRQHHGTFKVHKCSLCGKEYADEHKLESHAVIHIGYDERQKSKIWICDQCGKQFGSRSGLVRHIRQHQGAFKCELCQKVFGSQNGLAHHLKRHGTKDHLCSLCGTGFVEKYQLERHVKRRHDKIFQRCPDRVNKEAGICEQCGKQFETRQGLKRHVNQHKGFFKCKICQKVFGSENELAHHIKRSHDSVESEAGICEECGKQFATRRGLERHMNQHKGMFKCDVCQKVFGSVNDLGRHNKLHTGQKDHVCDHCGKGFAEKRNLHHHKLIHTRDKPFQCSECNKWFKTKRNLDRHSEIHRPEKGYRCSICWKAFRSRSGLYGHKKVHDDSSHSPLHCTVCEYTTPYRASLQVHMNIHTGNKPFACKLCDKSFAGRTGLRSHMFSHTGEKKYKCELCSKAFFRSNNVKRHMMAKHGDELQKSQP